MIISVSLLGLVFIFATNLLDLGARAIGTSSKEYDVQSGARLAASTAINKIRYSKTIFTIPKSSFRPDNLSVNWDYFGVEDVVLEDGSPASQIVQYTWNTTNKVHDKTVLVQPRSDIQYDLSFKKEFSIDAEGKLSESKLMSYNVVSHVKSADQSAPDYKGYVEIHGEAVANNALQVIEGTTDVDVATAIAYRNEDKPLSFVAHIAMILDNSGSMTDRMGSTTREAAMKYAAEEMINKIAAYDNIAISLIPFSYSANNPGSFFRPSLEGANLKNQIRNLTMDGPTNTGDAIRRAYYQLLEQGKRVAPAIPANYVILVVDGDTTACTVSPAWTEDKLRTEGPPTEANHYLGDGDIKDPKNFIMTYIYADGSAPWFYIPYYSVPGVKYESQIAGDGVYQLSFTDTYVTKTGNMMRGFAKPYIVALSENVSTHGLNTIVDAMDAPPESVFRADDAEALENAFEEIRDLILQDFWFLNGPQI
jgi:hypothetical protein